MTPSKINIMSTYALLVLIWATTPLAIIWSVTDLHSLWALTLRFFIALPLSIVLLLIVRAKFPVNAQSLHSYLAGACSFIGSQFFTYLAATYLSSGIIALMFGLAPIITGLIGYFVFHIHLRRMQWLGMLIAVTGLGIICLGGSEHQVKPLGIGLMLLSVFIYCASIFWVKKIGAPLEPMAQATGSIMVSSLFAACMLPFIWSYAPTEMPGLRSLIGLSYSVVMASLVAMFCYFKLVQNIQPATLSLTTVLTPILALVVGAILNDEKITVMVLLGAAVLLSGLFAYFYQDFKASRALAHKMKTD